MSFRTVRRRAKRAEGERGICYAAGEAILRLVLASKNRVLYVCVTGFLMARVLQHKSGECAGFTQRYKVNRLVYYEVFQ